ncbi:MAG: glycosyltransferase, partial [Candidatus Dormibacteraeota bacterium]|nr:glycosyltransferase [Candidatus Dormibacteraeota bacterium]
QVVDNNTTDPNLWRPIEEYCRRLGPRFSFLHLEDWPGYKAGALNEATRRLPPDVEVIGVVDSDYTVDPNWLRDVAGYFADPQVAFVQTPQDYRDWEDEPYLRGLYYSYRYFFALSMPARAHRNAIIFAGTMGLLRRRALEATGGWEESCITEDAEASLRMLGRGWSGIYVPTAAGKGMMPLTFDGLKKQRFRWALGGIQILRRHWRDLIGVGELRLTFAQRLHYLMGGLHWFGDIFQVFFTTLLLATAVAVAMHQALPIRQVTTSVLAIPLALLVTGLARALWALRASTGCRWRDALMAMRVWFALSWITAIACVRGVLRYQTAFLRTPKAPEEGKRWLRALAASRTESVIAIATALAGVAMLVRSPGIATAILAVLIAWQASVYANAPLAGMLAEGIRLTPERSRFLRSSQTTGERAARVGMAVAIPSAALALVVVAVLLGTLGTRLGTPGPPPSGPLLGPPSRGAPVLSTSPAPSATGSPSPAGTAAPTAAPTPVSTPPPHGTPGGGPSPPSTPGGAPTPRATGTP